jgi:hypothetical protein
LHELDASDLTVPKEAFGDAVLKYPGHNISAKYWLS